MIVISLGGSIMVKGEINVSFLRNFRKLILSHVRSGKRFFIICGGGRTARDYQAAASKISNLTKEDLDWLGIHATRLNAHLLRTIFRDHAHPVIIKDPRKRAATRKPIVIASGWKPGFSTDYDAVLIADIHDADTVINLTDVDYVYDKDPKDHREAKPINRITWKEFKKITGEEWRPGLNLPFDPLASREAEKLGLRVAIMRGTNLSNLDKFLRGENFIGTLIE